jgi:1-acyl-sn-glycerol-3-phosphate acyltransferase
MFYLRLTLGVLAFIAASAYGIGIAVLRRDRSRVAHDFARVLSRLMRRALALRVVVRGEENLYAQRPCIYISNHQSVFDVPILAGIYPPETVVIAKREIRKIPLFGWLYEVTGNVLIDRADRQQSVGRMKEAEEAIMERGASVWIFPEGTRGKNPGELLPFKKGAFYMAIASGAPLVPIVVSPLRELFDMKNRRIRSGTAEIRVLDPAPAKGLTEADVLPLMEIVHGRMQTALQEMMRPGEVPPLPHAAPHREENR